MVRQVVFVAVVGAALCAWTADAAPASIVPLTLTITGTGAVKVTGKPSIACKKTCHQTLMVKSGSRVVVLAKPGTLWKLAPWTGPCKGATAKCALTMTQAQKVAVSFIPPGAKANPIPLGTAWPVPGSWSVKIVGVTPSVQLSNRNGTPQTAPAGAQFFLMNVELTYNGGGSGRVGNIVSAFHAVGSLEVYGLDGYPGCGPGYGRLPAPDLQPKAENNEAVFSGQSVGGNVCFLVASNDASSLVFHVGDYSETTRSEQQVWFALAPAAHP